MEWIWWKDWWRIKKWKQNLNGENSDDSENYCFCDDCLVRFIIKINN